MGKVKYRKYYLLIFGNSSLIEIIEKNLPSEYDSMGEAFRKRRAILEIFPELDVRVISKQVKFRPVINDITRKEK